MRAGRFYGLSSCKIELTRRVRAPRARRASPAERRRSSIRAWAAAELSEFTLVSLCVEAFCIGRPGRLRGIIGRRVAPSLVPVGIATAAREQAVPDRRQRLLILAICSMSLFIVGLDATIVNIALPAIH